MLNSAALVDINGDNVRDIVIATYNSSVIAIDGSNYKVIWNTSFPNSESYSNIAVAYYDDDDIPDFLVKYQFGKNTHCGNLRIFLSLRFYVKSILESLEVLKLPFLPFLRL